MLFAIFVPEAAAGQPHSAEAGHAKFPRLKRFEIEGLEVDAIEGNRVNWDTYRFSTVVKDSEKPK